MEISLKGILGILGNIFSFFLQISPFPIIIKELKKRNEKFNIIIFGCCII